MAGKPSPRPKYLTSAGESTQCIKKPRRGTGASVSRVMDRLQGGEGCLSTDNSTLWPLGLFQPNRKSPDRSPQPLPPLK
jgi:hypothetical protein